MSAAVQVEEASLPLDESKLGRVSFAVLDSLRHAADDLAQFAERCHGVAPTSQGDGGDNSEHDASQASDMSKATALRLLASMAEAGRSMQQRVSQCEAPGTCDSLGVQAAPILFAAFCALRPFAMHPSDTAVRAAALRSTRFLLVSCGDAHTCGAITLADTVVLELVKSRTHLAIVRALVRSKAFLWERIQALKLARSIVDVAPEAIPLPVMRAVVAVARISGDPCRDVALEVARAAAISPCAEATRVVGICGGMDALFDAVLDPSCRAISIDILLSLLHVLNQPATRRCIRPRFAMQRLLAPLTSETGVIGNESDVDSSVEKSWQAAQSAIVTTCRTWTGLSLMGSDQHGLTTLVALLLQPIQAKLLLVVLDTIGQLLHPPTHWKHSRPAYFHTDTRRNMSGSRGLTPSGAAWGSHSFGTFNINPDHTATRHRSLSDSSLGGVALAARHRLVDARVGVAEHHATSTAKEDTRVSAFGLVDSYLAVLLRLLLTAGLSQGLHVLCTHNSDRVATTATLLLQDAIALAGRLLPQSVVSRRMGMPILVQLAALGANSHDRTMLAQSRGREPRRPQGDVAVRRAMKYTSRGACVGLTGGACDKLSSALGHLSGGAAAALAQARAAAPAAKSGDPARHPSITWSGRVAMGAFPGAVSGMGTTDFHRSAMGLVRLHGVPSAGGMRGGKSDVGGVGGVGSIDTDAMIARVLGCYTTSTRVGCGLGTMVNGGAGMVVGGHMYGAEELPIDGGEAPRRGHAKNPSRGRVGAWAAARATDYGGSGIPDRTVDTVEGHGVVPMVGLLGDLPGRSVRASIALRHLARASLHEGRVHMHSESEAVAQSTSDTDSAVQAAAASRTRRSSVVGSTHPLWNDAGLARSSLLLCGTEVFMPLSADHENALDCNSDSSDASEYDSQDGLDSFTDSESDSDDEGADDLRDLSTSPRSGQFSDDSSLPPRARGSSRSHSRSVAQSRSHTRAEASAPDLSTARPRLANADTGVEMRGLRSGSGASSASARTAGSVVGGESAGGGSDVDDAKPAAPASAKDTDAGTDADAAAGVVQTRERRAMSSALLGVLGLPAQDLTVTMDVGDGGGDALPQGTRTRRSMTMGDTRGNSRAAAASASRAVAHRLSMTASRSDKSPTRRRSRSQAPRPDGLPPRPSVWLRRQLSTESSVSAPSPKLLQSLGDGTLIVPPGVHVPGVPFGCVVSVISKTRGSGTPATATNTNQPTATPTGLSARARRRGSSAASRHTHLMRDHHDTSVRLYGSAQSGVARSIGHEIMLMRAVSTGSIVFAEALRRTNVLAGKDWRVWNWCSIASLLDGPLATSASYLREALRTKFFRRVCGFFRAELGAKGCFSHLPWVPAMLRYLRVARQAMLLLLHHPEGRAFLTMDRRGSFVADILACLHTFANGDNTFSSPSSPGGPSAQQQSGGQPPDVRKLLSRRMFETGAAREYIALLGVVTSCTAGRVYLDNLAAWRTRGSACLDAVVPDASVHGAGSAAAASSNDTEATSALSRLRAASGVNNLRSPHRASNSASGSAFGFGSSGATSSSGAGGSSSRSRGSVVGAAPTTAGVGGEGAGSVIAAMASQARFGSDLIGLLASLGAKPQRHYLCRQLLACLDFSGRPDDGEAVNDSARHLLHTWMLDEHMPASLRLFTTCFLRVLLRRGVPGFSEWGVDLLVEQLVDVCAASQATRRASGSLTAIANSALGVLVEAADSGVYLRAIVRAVALRPELLGPDSPLLVDTVHGAAGTGCLPVDPTLVHALLLRLLADDGGVGLLRQTNLAEVLIKGWQVKGSNEYALMVERALLHGFSVPASHAGHSDTAAEEGDTSSAHVPTPISVHIPCGAAGGSTERGWFSLSTLMRLPWRVEVWVSYADAAGGASAGMGEQIPVDTYVDLSHYRPDLGGAPDIRIAAVALARSGKPSPFSVPPGATLRAALFVGECAVGCAGSVSHTVLGPATAGDIRYGLWPGIDRDDTHGHSASTGSPVEPSADEAAAATAGGTAAAGGGPVVNGIPVLSEALHWVADVGALGVAHTQSATGDDSGGGRLQEVRRQQQEQLRDLCRDMRTAVHGEGRVDPSTMNALRSKGLLSAEGIGSQAPAVLHAGAVWFGVDTSGVADNDEEGDSSSCAADTNDASAQLQSPNRPRRGSSTSRTITTPASQAAATRSRRASGGGAAPAFGRGHGNAGGGGSRMAAGASTGSASPGRRVTHVNEPVEWSFSTSVMFAGSVRFESLSFALSPLPHRPASAPLPRHLYGEAARCPAGRDMIRAHRAVENLARTVCNPSGRVLERRAALWSIGHICACADGVKLVQELAPSLLSSIAAMARSASVLSLRGTCIHALGLASQSAAGEHLLKECGWAKATGCTAPAVVPVESPAQLPPLRARDGWLEHGFNCVFNMDCDTNAPPTPDDAVAQFCASPANAVDCCRPVDALDVTADPEELDVLPVCERQLLRAIAKLANAISVGSGRSQIARLRASAPDMFSSAKVLLRVHALLAQCRLPFHQCRAVLRCFEQVDACTSRDGGWLSAQ